MKWKTLFASLCVSCVGIAAVIHVTAGASPRDSDPPAGKGDTARDLDAVYGEQVQPLLDKYCLKCHSAKVQKGDLDLQRFTTAATIRKDVRPWQQVIERVEMGEMPPKGQPQPTAMERKLLVTWVRAFLDAEARARTGDPGHVPLRRLSNAEYDCTIRDLTGVDLKPAREFPADGAAGEGFTNAAESLSEITPPLFSRYLKSAKDIADHAVLLPDGFRFSAGKTRRDWTDESLVKLRDFYQAFTRDGRLTFQPYLHATIRHREALTAGKISLAEVAAREKLNGKYLGILWQTLNGKTPSYPLDALRQRWRAAGEKEVVPLVADIARWQTALWKLVKIGSYRNGTRQSANNPPAANTQSVRLTVKPAPGQKDVVLHLRSHALSGTPATVVWQRPRFERAGKPPLLLKDYARFGAAFEVDHSTIFADTAQYLQAVAELAHHPNFTVEDVAGKTKLDPTFLKRWAQVLVLRPASAQPVEIPALALERLDQKTPRNNARPSIWGWSKKGTDLPVVVSNASDEVLQIPGTIGPRKVAVHPTPKEFVAIVWQSPLTGKVDVEAAIAHAHPACGNGVAWWLEQRRDGKAFLLAEGTLDLGKKGKTGKLPLGVQQGDQLVLAVDARANNHFCDLTEVACTVSESANPMRVWDLAADVASSIQKSNPHPDKYGDKDVWSFVRGPAKNTSAAPDVFAVITPASLLGQWRSAAAEPARRAEADKIAQQVQKLLIGPRPADAKHPDRILFDAVVAADGVLLNGLDVSRFTDAGPKSIKYGLPAEHFGMDGKSGQEANLATVSEKSTSVRLPARLFQGREFVVEGSLVGDAHDHVVLFEASAVEPELSPVWDGKSPVVAASGSAGYMQLLSGFDEFRRCFPWYLCFPAVVPTDEVVSLKMFHREDEPLVRLFLDADQQHRLEKLWAEHEFVSQQPVAENKYLPQFIGYVTQDQPKATLDYFLAQRPIFKKRAEAFLTHARAAEPKQLAALMGFAGRAFRRPLSEQSRAELQGLYQKLREKKVPHDEAFRGVLTRVLVSPAFLFRIEKAPPGTKPGPVDDWELATRLSYFLWSSLPDDELRTLAAAGKLRDPEILQQQTRRMLRDERLRTLAIEFGTQWLHVRNFDELKEKNEKLFPMFDRTLREAIYEESILFFQDLFQQDRPVTRILDADYTFLNETLAKHYGIPGVSGQQWRRVEGVRKQGRGGILGLASVHAKQSGASRTSPVLRGNWVVETLLGEKLPRPPADVPILPDEAVSGTDKLTTRQRVEKHVSVASCAACHVRIDPYGFAFENFDPIGRWRTQEAGIPVDTRAKLRDGTEFDGIDGLRIYLLAQKKDVIVRLFCKKLLGYALGRATTLSDTTVIDEMVAELNKNEGRISTAVLTIVRSPQFRMIRGSDFEE